MRAYERSTYFVYAQFSHRSRFESTEPPSWAWQQSATALTPEIAEGSQPQLLIGWFVCATWWPPSTRIETSGWTEYGLSIRFWRRLTSLWNVGKYKTIVKDRNRRILLALPTLPGRNNPLLAHVYNRETWRCFRSSRWTEQTETKYSTVILSASSSDRAFLTEKNFFWSPV